MAEPTSLTGFELPLALRKTHDGEQFLLHDFGPQDENRVIVFATLPGLDLLSLSDVIWSPDLIWSNGVAITVKNYLPRTNNAVEGWNSNFVKLVNIKHPSFPKLIENFQDEQKNAEILLQKMCA